MRSLATLLIGARCCNSAILAPPVIERKPNDRVYAEGEMVRLKIYYSGTGPFTTRLTLNKLEVDSSHPVIKLVEFDDHVLITIIRIGKLETGRYEFYVNNDSGQASCSFNLNVTGLPGPPTGPMEIFNIDRVEATLKWAPPKDDGGSKILHYAVERRDTSRDEWTKVASFAKVGLSLIFFTKKR